MKFFVFFPLTLYPIQHTLTGNMIQWAYIMNTENQLIGALKILLKQQKKTYKDVSLWLDLSEGSVKRLFSKGDMSLERMGLILEELGRDINDLVSIINADNRQISQITEEQEAELVNDIPTLLTALTVLSDLSCEEIASHYGFDDVTVERALLKLDKMNILSLSPSNNYQLNVHPHFRWLAGGPIQQFFMEHLAMSYLSSDFQGRDEMLLLPGMLSEESQKRLQWLIDEFAQRVQELNMNDRLLPKAEKEAVFVVLVKRCNWNSGLR